MGTYTGEAGCLIDGHNGRYGIPRVVDIAVDYGFELDSEAQALMANREDEPDSEPMIWLSEEAEAFLNEKVANDGYSFGWHDGEFFYWSTEMWQED